MTKPRLMYIPEAGKRVGTGPWAQPRETMQNCHTFIQASLGHTIYPNRGENLLEVLYLTTLSNIPRLFLETLSRSIIGEWKTLGLPVQVEQWLRELDKVLIFQVSWSLKSDSDPLSLREIMIAKCKTYWHILQTHTQAHTLTHRTKLVFPLSRIDTYVIYVYKYTTKDIQVYCICVWVFL